MRPVVSSCGRAARYAAAVAARQFLVAEDEVVHRVDVFEELAIGDEAHAAGLAGRVEFAGEPVGLGVEIVIVLDFR